MHCCWYHTETSRTDAATAQKYSIKLVSNIVLSSCKSANLSYIQRAIFCEEM